MRTTSILAAIAATLIIAAALGRSPAVAQTEMTPEFRRSLHEVIRTYLLDNPEVIAEAVRGLEEKQRLAAEEDAKQALKTHRKALFDDPSTPSQGAADADVTLVEFFDYRCGVCRRAHPIVASLASSDRKIRRVYKEWPILGPESVYAARAALASQFQGRYVAFHDALMETRVNLTEQSILDIAGRVGLDRAQLVRDIERPEIEAAIKRNFELAEALRINGTPSFVIGDTVVRGARDLQTMKSIVAEARAAKR
jgi:protein-disulfide isomerase